MDIVSESHGSCSDIDLETLSNVTEDDEDTPGLVDGLSDEYSFADLDDLYDGDDASLFVLSRSFL